MLFRALVKIFGLSKRSTIGLIVLMAIVVVVWWVNISTEHLQMSEVRTTVFNHDSLRFDSIARELRIIENRKKLETRKPFDPNTASFDDFIDGGVPGYIVADILAFRDAGGTFLIKSDMRKIHSLPEALYVELYPLIDLPIDRRKPEGDKQVLNQAIYLNRCTHRELETIKGIGKAYSSRVIDYRERLGGFVTTNQLFDIEKMTEAKARLIAENTLLEPMPTVRILDLNTSDTALIGKHPYLGRQVAISVFKKRKLVPSDSDWVKQQMPAEFRKYYKRYFRIK